MVLNRCEAYISSCIIPKKIRSKKGVDSEEGGVGRSGRVRHRVQGPPSKGSSKVIGMVGYRRRPEMVVPHTGKGSNSCDMISGAHLGKGTVGEEREGKL